MTINLKDFRSKQDKTQLEVANIAGISRSHYNQIESGKRTPSVDTAKKIANVLGFNWEVFFETKCS